MIHYFYTRRKAEYSTMPSKFLQLLILLLSLLFGSSIAFGQAVPNLRIKHLSYEDGLVGRRATQALQDSDGFMWIATMDALNRYDGFSFRHFNQSNSALNYREVKTLYEDEAGYLWLKYLEGVELIHHRTWEVLTFEERFPEVGFSGNEIRDVIGNEQGVLLLQLKNTQIYLYRNGTFQLVDYLNYTPSSTPTILYFDGISLGNDGIQICQNNQITLYDFDGQRRYTEEVQGKPILNQPKEQITAITYNEATKNYQLLSCDANGCSTVGQLGSTPLDAEFDELRMVYNGAQQLVWLYNILEHGRTMYAIDLQTQQLYPVPLTGNKSVLCQDNNGVVWVANGDGVALLQFRRSPFTYYEGAEGARGIWANTEKVVVATSFDEDYCYDLNTAQGQLLNTNIHALASDQKTFWGGDRGYFYHFNPQTLQTLETIPTQKSSVGNIWSSLKDSDGNWWFGHELNNTKKYILSYRPAENDSIGLFRQFNGFEHLQTAFVLQFLEDGNLIWAASDQGLIAIDKQKGVLANYHEAAAEGFQLPFQEVHWLYKDAENTYWVATNYDGLVRFTLDKNGKVLTAKRYATDYHLSSDVIYSIFEDAHQRLWLSTLNGLSIFDKKMETVRILTDQYGELPFNEFNRTSGFQAPDGRLYFGGIKGAIGFHPADIDTSSYDKELVLSAVDFYSGDQEELSDQRLVILENNKIVIEPSVRFVKIEVALTDYLDAKDARYFYKIEGLHDDFRPLDGNSIQLSNLPYGKYRLRFRGQARDKRFSTSEINLPLVVVRPFYLRWWFVLLVLLAVVGLFRLFYNWRVAQLKRRQLELEAIVAQRTEKIREDKLLIEQQAEELKALDQLKDRFFANISHELRTPLTLILGPLGSILKSSDNLTNKQFTYLKVIKRHAEYLRKRINEIMELNRLEVNKGQVDQEPVQLYDFLKVVIGNFESIAPEKNILFTFDYQMKKTAQILLDKNKFEHVIYNYLSNAFKYTPQNGRVKVSVTEVDNKLRLEVQDTGAGIPKADIPNLFDRFYQAENAQKAGSSGIGLALCREIADLLNGRVWAESEVGKGSRFYFEIPIEEVVGIVPAAEVPATSEVYKHKQITEATRTAAAADTQPTILLVEDNPELQEYIQAILSEHYQVKTAENGAVALQLLGIDRGESGVKSDLKTPPPSLLTPDLIISDIMMPVMDGLELLETIKKTTAYRHIPMVMLTARQGMEAKLSALQLGVDDYITKPFDEDELLIRIQNLLHNQRERIAFLAQEQAAKAPSTANSEENPLVPHISENDQQWLTALETLVTDNLGNSQFTLATCAEQFFVSERQLQRRIKKCTGLSFVKYLRLARLQKARQLLESGSVSTMAEVAFAVGFETPAYFSKVFYQEFGRKPVSYLSPA